MTVVSLDELNAPRATGMTAIDLFSGAGGLSLGLQLAGGSPVGGVDFDEDSINTYKSNFPRALYTHCGAIEDWNPAPSLEGTNVIIGGPPCQGFSLARGQRFVDDPRNSLYKHFVRTVEEVRPEWFVLENVEGILNIGGGLIREQIFEDFEIAGYTVAVRVINMADYGVPQRRRRAIFVGHRNGKEFHWPDPMHSKLGGNDVSDDLPRHRSVYDALGDLDLPQGNYFAHRANSQMRGPRNRVVATEPAFTLRVRGDEFALCEHPAESSFIPGAKPDEPLSARAPGNVFQELMQGWLPEGGTSHALARTTSRPKKLKGTRRLTIREQARLQSFPDAFNFTGSVVSQARQIGNAVPPLFGKVLFESIAAQS